MIELPLEMPMTGHRPTLERAWDDGIAALTAHTSAGRDVAYLCLGDTLLYGSFGYLLARYDGPVEVVPGVISPVAAASALRLPLVEGREPLVIVPDGSDLELLRRRARARGDGRGDEAVAPGRRRRRAAARDRRRRPAWVSQDVTLSSQRLFRAASADELAALPYFSLIVIPPAGRNGDAA